MLPLQEAVVQGTNIAIIHRTDGDESVFPVQRDKTKNTLLPQLDVAITTMFSIGQTEELSSHPTT